MVFCMIQFAPPLHIVHGTLDAIAAPVEDEVGHHGGLHILVAYEFLDRLDVLSTFQELNGVRMSKGMGGRQVF